MFTRANRRPSGKRRITFIHGTVTQNVLRPMRTFDAVFAHRDRWAYSLPFLNNGSTDHSGRAMRIAMISTPHLPSPPRGYGASELIAGLLAEGLRRRGHHVRL